MDLLRRQNNLILKNTPTKIVRDIYDKIPWEERLIGIKGARGVGKTILMCQRILLAFPDKSKALYTSLDNIWFSDHTLIDLAEKSMQEGITHLFIDEVHKYRGWEREVKNIYDFYKDIHIVFTGSSLLEIDNSVVDLSRRCLLYDMTGLSFREYLKFQGFEFSKLQLSQVLFEHPGISLEISQEIPVIKLFHKYLKEGFYPFNLESKGEAFLQRVSNIINTVIYNDIPAVYDIEYETQQRAKQMLAILSVEPPSPLNAKNMSEKLNVTNNQLIKLLSLLDKAEILRLLYYRQDINPKAIVKPQKILFNNSSLLYALGNENIGKVRETFVASSLADDYKIGYPKDGDLIIENRYLLEIGGSKKSYRQIADIPDSFLVVDDIEEGYGNRIPIWLFGFLK